jgi:hypothetical protein
LVILLWWEPKMPQNLDIPYEVTLVEFCLTSNKKISFPKGVRNRKFSQT